MDPHAGARHNEEIAKLGGVIVEHVVHTADPYRDFGVVAEAKQHHAAVRLPLSHDKFAEVIVRSDQDSLLLRCNLQDTTVGQTGRIVSRDSCRVISTSL